VIALIELYSADWSRFDAWELDVGKGQRPRAARASLLALRPHPSNFCSSTMEGGSGSAILPPKRPPRTPLKLSLAAPSPIPPPSLSLSRPSSSQSPSSASSARPSLKLAAISSGVGQLSLSIPQAGPSRYATALNGPQDSDDEERPPGSGYSTSDDDEDGDNAKWGEGDQERMAGELLDVIRGPVGLEDELSGRTRRMRMRSSSRVGERPSSSSSRSIEISQKGLFGGDDSLEDELATPQTARPPPPADDDALESAVEPIMEVTAATIQDLGRLGEGASGEVRRVMHRPSGVVMAKKVSGRIGAETSCRADPPASTTDHRHLA